MLGFESGRPNGLEHLPLKRRASRRAPIFAGFCDQRDTVVPHPRARGCRAATRGTRRKRFLTTRATLLGQR